MLLLGTVNFSQDGDQSEPAAQNWFCAPAMLFTGTRDRRRSAAAFGCTEYVADENCDVRCSMRRPSSR